MDDAVRQDGGLTMLKACISLLRGLCVSWYCWMSPSDSWRGGENDDMCVRSEKGFVNIKIGNKRED